MPEHSRNLINFTGQPLQIINKSGNKKLFCVYIYIPPPKFIYTNDIYTYAHTHTHTYRSEEASVENTIKIILLARDPESFPRYVVEQVYVLILCRINASSFSFSFSFLIFVQLLRQLPVAIYHSWFGIYLSLSDTYVCLEAYLRMLIIKSFCRRQNLQ